MLILSPTTELWLPKPDLWIPDRKIRKPSIQERGWLERGWPALPMQMAPAIEGVGSVPGEFVSDAGALDTFAVDCGTNANRFAVVGVTWIDLQAHTVTGVTIGGNAMTEFGPAFKGSNNIAKMHLWFYTAPGTGSQDVIVSHSSGSGTDAAVASSAAYSGVNQATPFTGYTTDDGNDANADVTLTSATGDVLVTIVGSRSGSWSADDANATIRVEEDGASNTGNIIADRPGAASVDTEHTTPANEWRMGGFSLAPVAAAAPGEDDGFLPAPPGERPDLVAVYS